MSKIKCTCGHIIIDQTDNITYKGHILPDSNVDDLSQTLTESIDTYVKAIKSSSKSDWVKKNFTVPPYPQDLEMSSMIHDLISGRALKLTKEIFECEKYGRLAIESNTPNQYKFFSPDNKEVNGLLDLE